MIRIGSMPMVFQWLSYLDYIRFGISASLIDIYGFGRCTVHSAQNQSHWMDSISEEQLLQIYSSDKIDSELLISSVGSLMGSLVNTEEDRSSIMKKFDLIEPDYYFAQVMLYTHIIFFRAATYFIILKKIDMAS